jgi:hypothetical protein
VCTDPVVAGGDRLELLTVVKRENIPPPSYDYLEMVSSTLEEDPAATSTCGKTNPQTYSSSSCFFSSSSSCPPPFSASTCCIWCRGIWSSVHDSW